MCGIIDRITYDPPSNWVEAKAWYQKEDDWTQKIEKEIGIIDSADQMDCDATDVASSSEE